MKNSSMNMAPNGKIPAIRILGDRGGHASMKTGKKQHQRPDRSVTYPTNLFMYQRCSGTCRGIWLVRTGLSYGCFRKPK